MAFSLLGYFVCMIAVLTAAAGAMIGLFNSSTSEKVHHYPRPVFERNVTGISTEPRLFMVAPGTKDASPAKNKEANSAVAPDEKAEAKKGTLHKQKTIARNHDYERPSYGNALGYAEYTRQRPFSTR
jgi:hypothetical protein